jgi:predicted RNA-binding protein with PIN domain
MIIFGDGARRMSASELAAAVELSAKELREQYLKKNE